MKLQLLFALLPVCALSQGTFIYDQQSSADDTPFAGSGPIMQNIATPWGQSFTPSLQFIDFIRLKFSDYNPTNGLGAVVFVNLHSSSISGPLLGSTEPVAMPDGFAGPATFLFSSPISITAGTLYYLEPILQSGDQWQINSGEFNYFGGDGILGGVPQVASDLWFREGIIIPEPSTFPLMLLGLSSLLFILKRRHRR